MSRTALFSHLGSLVLAAVLASSLSAHCRVLTPNGGEVLRAGCKVTIRWKILVVHPQKDWDLWYSTTGVRGPWIPIKMDMPVKQLSYEWTVPHSLVGKKLRFRIRQDNQRYDTYDISDGDTMVMSSLASKTAEISIGTGGTQAMDLDADLQNANRNYWVFGSMTGTNPGVALGTVKIPLLYDAYTDLTLVAPNTAVFRSSRGKLDAKGRAQARLNLPKGLPPSALGLSLYHAFVTYTGTQVHMASSPLALKLVR